MIRFSKWALSLLLFLVLSASLHAENAPLTIAVSLQPYAHIVNSIGGTKVNVVTLIPPGADPHTFEPKPATLKAFAKADVYLTDGSGMDAAWMPRFKGVNKDVKVISMTDRIQWMNGGHHDHDYHQGSELDPHLWTSPKQIVVIANNVRNILISLDSAHRDFYTQKLLYFLNKIDNLNSELATAVHKMPEDRRTFIVFHPSYGYLARDYGLRQLSVEMNGKEPKPQDLKMLIKEGKEHNVHIVFVQPQFSKRSASIIAKELNAVVLQTDPLAYDFISNLKTLVSAIEKASVK